MALIREVLQTRRGKKCFFFESYKFREFRTLVDGTIHFRCTNKSCKVNVYTDSAVTKVLDRVGLHTHAICSEDDQLKDTVRATLKRKAEEEPHTKPNKLVRLEVRQKDDSNKLTHKDFLLFRKSIYNKRRQRYPVLPKTSDEAVQQLEMMKDEVLHKGAQFCYVIQGIPIMTTRDNLSLLFQSEYVFGDGTFENSPRHFEQLYTIHVYMMGYYIPVVFCCLRAKDKSTYVRMWEGVRQLCYTFFHCVPDIQKFYSDFEKAAQLAVLEFYSNCTLVGCNFHLGQSWIRRILGNGLLREAYCAKEKCELGQWLKSFYGLAHLPSAEVLDAFTDLVSVAPITDMTFPDYILKTYVDVDATFPPSMWASEPTTCPRTNNSAESFHSHYNAMFYAKPHIHTVVNNLLEIQVETDLKINSIRRFQWNARCTTTIDKIKYTQQEYGKYKRGEINRLQYLRRAGHRWQPSAKKF